MNKILFGLITGTILGLLDGLSAFFIPEAAPMLTVIIISATVKGAITGCLIGVTAKKVKSLSRNMVAGILISGVLSFLAAIQSGSYVEIVVPGIIAGIITVYLIYRFCSEKRA